MANSLYHLAVWIDGRWKELIWSETDFRHHVESAFKERERMFVSKYSDFSDDLSAKVCAEALRKLCESVNCYPT